MNYPLYMHICIICMFPFWLQELCEKGGILFLAQSVLKLNIQSSFPCRIVAGISRLKSKILSIVSRVENLTHIPDFEFNLLHNLFKLEGKSWHNC
jgi:hypothetical protein